MISIIDIIYIHKYICSDMKIRLNAGICQVESLQSLNVGLTTQLWFNLTTYNFT